MKPEPDEYCERCFVQLAPSDVVWCGDEPWCWVCCEANIDEYRALQRERMGDDE